MTALKVNAGDFGTLALDGEKFYFRCRSFVDIKTGQLLPERRQQKVVIATRNGQNYKSIEKSKDLHILADERRAKIIAWETAAQNGVGVNANGELIAPDVPLIDPADDITVTDFFNTVFMPAKKILKETEKLAAITIDTYQNYWDMFLSKHFNATMTIKNYRASTGRHYLQNLRKADGTFYGENTVKKIHSVASAIFTEAVERELREENPFQNIKRDRIPNRSAEQGIAYTEAEVEAMIQNLDAELAGLSDVSRTSRGKASIRFEQKRHSIRSAQVALALGFWAGLRPSEIIALDWANVDVLEGKLKVCESTVNHVHAERTKTNEDRVVKYLEPLVPVLRAWKAANGNPKSGPVLRGWNGGTINLNHLSDKIIYPNCNRNGLGERWKGTAFYGLRRGCGTLLVETGSSIEQGAKFLGNTAAVFEENYWVDRGAMTAQAAENYRQKRLAKQEEKTDQQEREMVTDELAALGLGAGEGL